MRPSNAICAIGRRSVQLNSPRQNVEVGNRIPSLRTPHLSSCDAKASSGKLRLKSERSGRAIGRWKRWTQIESHFRGPRSERSEVRKSRCRAKDAKNFPRRNGFRILAIGWLCAEFGRQIINSVVHHHGGPLFFALSLIPLFLVLWWLRSGEAGTKFRFPAKNAKDTKNLA